MDDFDYGSLSPDPKVAFVTLERKFREELNRDLNSADSNYDHEMAQIRYMSRTLTAVHHLDLNILKEWQIPSVIDVSDSTTNLFARFRDFLIEADSEILKINISSGQTYSKYSIALTNVDKEIIRHYVGKIKLVIDGADIPVTKKDALYNKINTFLKEVDKARTWLVAASDLIIGLAHIGGEAAKELEPARKWMDSIARLIGRNQDHEDALRALTAPLEQKRIEPPRLRVSGPPEPPQLDDDIPF